MILDASALLAILQREPEAAAFAQAIEAASACRVSAATLVEASIVMESSHGPHPATLEVELTPAGVIVGRKGEGLELKLVLESRFAEAARVVYSTELVDDRRRRNRWCRPRRRQRRSGCTGGT